ncbi:MAG: rhodanese-like domain-containing protein [Thermoleophilia bacterium]
MVKSRRLFLIILVLMGLLLSTAVAIAGCGEEKTTTTTATITTATKDTATVINDRGLKVLAATPTSGEYVNNTISAKELVTKLADPAEKAKLMLLDVRSKADYDKGHIEGAIQVDFKQWAATDNLQKLDASRKIIVICYTGNTAAQATSGLRMLGFDAAVLKAGMNGWVKSDATDKVVADLNAAAYPVVTTPASASTPGPATSTFAKPSAADYQVLAEKANMIMTAMPAEGDYALNTITAANLNTKLTGAEKDKIFVLDVRSTADFDKGHIEGAINVPWLATTVPDNLKMLPKDKKIVVACYTGNTAAQATTILRMLDYDAAVLKFGMMGWAGNGKDGYITDIQAAANPVVTS